MVLFYFGPITTPINGIDRTKHINVLSLIAVLQWCNICKWWWQWWHFHRDYKLQYWDLSHSNSFVTISTILVILSRNVSFASLLIIVWQIKKISTDSDKPLIACYSHKLSLEVNRRISNTTELDFLIEIIHNTIKDARAKYKMLPYWWASRTFLQFYRMPPSCPVNAPWLIVLFGWETIWCNLTMMSRGF